MSEKLLDKEFVEEIETRDELVELAPESGIEVFKRHIVQVFDVDPEFVEKLTVRKGLKHDFREIPTRREEQGYEWIPTAEDRKRSKSVPDWARNVACPKCGGIMTPLTSKLQTRFGENVTYQCHTISSRHKMCLLQVQLMTGVYYMMRPGDFSKSDWDWQVVAQQTTPVVDGVEVEGVDNSSSELPKVAPPNPWSKGRTQSKVVWEVFWSMMLEHGEVNIKQLRENIEEIRPQDKSGRHYERLERSIQGLPGRMLTRTGFVIKPFNGSFKFLGRSRGKLDLFPFSEETYRKEFGFQ